MENTLQLLTGKQAAEFLNLGYKTFMKEVKKGAIGYKIVGSVRRYPMKALQEWLNNTTFHLEFTKEAKSTIHISRSSVPTDSELSLDYLRDKYFPKMRRNGASNISKS